MTASQRVCVTCEYSPDGDPRHRQVDQATLICSGETEHHVIEALQRVFPSWQYPVIIDLHWQR